MPSKLAKYAEAEVLCLPNKAINNKKAIRLALLMLLTICSLFTFKIAHADSNPSCNIMLRLVEPRMLPAAQQSDKSIHMSSFLADADEQLSALPFNDYRPLAMQQARVALGKKSSFMLSAKDSPQYKVTVGLKSVDNSMIGLRVDWSEKGGRQILSTQLKVPDGENVVVGSDKLKGMAMVILIKPQCN